LKKNVIVNLLYYGCTLLLVPAVLLSIETHFLVRRPSVVLRVISLLLGGAGIVIQSWAIDFLERFGKGTPSPAVPTQQLVTVGPYRYVRNPLNTGEVMLLLALAGWFASPAVFAYSLLAWLAFHLFIIRWEEPRLEERFGDRYSTYRATVGRWIPKM